ncbi:MAG: FG-GAP repeat domain-containing protein [Phycisphaerales bacterium]
MKQTNTSRTLSTTCTLAALTITCAVHADDPLLDAPWRGFDAGHFPTYAPENFAVGDVNGDSVPDIVAAREAFSGPGLSVLLGLGDGTYTSPAIYETGIGRDIYDVKLADVDADGDLDAVATMPGPSDTGFRVTLWRNDGEGGFADYEPFIANEGPHGLALVDVNGDGLPDVVTANEGYVFQGNTISVLLHNGVQGPGAAFNDAVNYTLSNGPHQIAHGDLDGDGDVDLAVACQNLLELMLNDGTGAFTSAGTFVPVPGAYRQAPVISLVDIDNDGDLDLLGAGVVRATFGKAQLSLRRNDGEGGFPDTPEIIEFPDGSWTPHTICTSDLNADGFADLTITYGGGRGHDGFWTMLSDGQGKGFGSATYYFAAKGTREVEAVDADRDGDLDLVTAANDSSLMTVHLNDGAGSFPTLPAYGLPGFTKKLARGDLDNDGDLDVVSLDSHLRILSNNGDGSFASFVSYTLPSPNPRNVVIGDFTGDGFLDIMLALNNQTLTIVINQGDGTFTSHVSHPIGAYLDGLQAIDLDGDGDLDLVGSTQTGQHSYIPIRNDNNSNFVPQPSIPTPWRVTDFALVDIDHDDTFDLVAGSSDGMMVNLGTAPFAFADEITSSEAPYAWALGDANADGDLDVFMLLAQPSFGTTTVGLALGYGDGSFGFVETVPGTTGRESAYRIATEVDAADMNGDGFDDLILTSNAPKAVSIFASNGVDQLLSANGHHYGAGYSATITLIDDFDNDGTRDALTKVSPSLAGFSDGVVLLRGLSGRESGQAPLENVTAALGTILSGGLAELEESDNLVLRCQSQFGFLSSEPNVLDLRVEATSSLDTPEEINIDIEARLNNPGGNVTVRLRNWNSNTLMQVDAFGLGTTEQREAANVQPASQYVRAGDSRIELSMKTVVIATFSTSGFRAEVDQIAIAVR